ncbi:MAG: hypothetical protein J7641_03860 [Cyanobacteria bacterium SID2]|nr:hypothetical protein [Cyanobacteria bacterium SID2]MBP0004682.1 hypothetical protein [Cyanobacteria bacterium SBC]
MLKLLYNLRQNLSIDPKSEEAQELIMRLAPLYQQDRERAVRESIEQGIQQDASHFCDRNPSAFGTSPG